MPLIHEVVRTLKEDPDLLADVIDAIEKSPTERPTMIGSILQLNTGKARWRCEALVREALWRIRNDADAAGRSSLPRPRTNVMTVDVRTRRAHP